MSKKRRTKQEKIIARLKRQIKTTQQKTAEVSEPDQKPKIATKATQTSEVAGLTQPKQLKKQADKSSLYFYDPRLIKKSLIKTIFLSLFFFSLIITLYLLIEFKQIIPL
jgi:preprotein translocase subunit SecF